jgi:hypothetical protein
MSSLPGQSPPFSDFSPGTILKPISRLRPPMPRFEAIVPFPPGIICLGCVESDPRFLYERTKPGPLETAYSENSPAPSHQAGSNLQNAVTPRRISNFHTLNLSHSASSFEFCKTPSHPAESATSIPQPVPPTSSFEFCKTPSHPAESATDPVLPSQAPRLPKRTQFPSSPSPPQSPIPDPPIRNPLTGI